MKILNKTIDLQSVLLEINKYSHEMAKRTALEIRKQASFDLYQENILKIYQETLNNNQNEPVENNKLYGKITNEYKSLKRILYENKLTSLQNEVKKNCSLICTQSEELEILKNTIIKIKNSKSYKIGRAVTFPARCIKKCLHSAIRKINNKQD